MKDKTVYLIGFMASGKTQMGKKIAKSLDYHWIDLDEYIAEKVGLPVKNIFNFWGEEKFREIERTCLQEIRFKKPLVISCGGGTPCYFDNIGYMLQHGVVVYLNVPSGMLVQRLVANPKNRPLLSGKTEQEIELLVTEMMQVRKPFYEQAQMTYKVIEEEYQAFIERLKNSLH